MVHTSKHSWRNIQQPMCEGSKHEIKAKIFLWKHWVTSPNHRPQHSRTRLFSMHLKVWVKPFWLKPSCLSWIMSSRKQNPQNMQSLPRGDWIVAELLFFEILQIHLFVLWFGCLQRNLSPKARCLMLQERLEETEWRPSEGFLSPLAYEKYHRNVGVSPIEHSFLKVRVVPG